MKIHLKNKDFALYISKSSNIKREAEIESHLSACKQCRDKLSRLLKINNPSLPQDIKPDSIVFNRILNSYKNIKTHKINKTTSKKWQLLKPGPAISFALIFIIFSLFLYNNYSQEKISIKTSHIAGKIIYNKQLITKNNKEIKKGYIETSKNSRIILQYNNIFKLRVFSNTKMTIDEALLNKIKQKYNFKFKVKKGSIISTTNHSESNLSYVISTPHADFNPIGTDFLLQVSNDESKLILKDGKVEIVLRAKTQSLVAQENNVYIVSSDITKKSISAHELKLYQNLKIMFDSNQSFESNGKNNSTLENKDTDSIKDMLQERNEQIKIKHKLRKDMFKNQRSSQKKLHHNRHRR